MKWIALAATVASLALAPADPADCVSLAQYSSSMAEFPLRDVPLYKDGEAAGRALEIDLDQNPSVVRLEGASPADWPTLCVRREDIERHFAYQLSVLEHDWDGLACVTFDEGRPHSKLFQRNEHNIGRELRLYPFGRSRGEWRRIDARAGFTREAFRFECGIQVGDPVLAELLKGGNLPASATVVRADSPLAQEPGFSKSGEFQWHGAEFLIGAGLGLPEPAPQER